MAEEREVLPPGLVRRSNGTIHTRVWVDGRDVWRSTGHTTVRMAQKEAERIRTELRDGQAKLGRVPTFGEFWRDTYEPVYTALREHPELDRQHVRHAMALFRHKRLDQVTKSLCIRHLNERKQKARPSTVNRERGTLQAIFERAVEDGLIERNPWKGIEKERTEPRIRVLTPEHELLLRQQLTPRYQRWLTFMLGTGLRLAEARAIHVGLVDFEGELIHVPAEAAKGKKKRSVPLFTQVRRAIEQQQAEVGYLWPAHPQEFRDRLNIKAKKAGIPHLSPHDLRHTFATRYLRGGGDIFILSRILGHASVKMTESVYVHLLSEDLVERSRGVDLGL